MVSFIIQISVTLLRVIHSFSECQCTVISSDRDEPAHYILVKLSRKLTYYDTDNNIDKIVMDSL